VQDDGERCLLIGYLIPTPPMNDSPNLQIGSRSPVSWLRL
jgi:hypothetical protein